MYKQRTKKTNKMSNRKQLQQTVKTQSVDKMLPYLLSFCMLSDYNEKNMLIKSKCYFKRNKGNAKRGASPRLKI